MSLLLCAAPLVLLPARGRAEPDRSGCADGRREGFLPESRYPEIAGCSGAWTVPGIHPHRPGRAPACASVRTHDTLKPACGRAAGDNGNNPHGRGCNVADLCARGWHVCSGAAEVARRSPDGCLGATREGDPPLFFATRQSSNGCGHCTTGSSTGPGCNSASCEAGCLQTARTSNDVFGCGNFGAAAPILECEPLQRFSGNLCTALAGSPWTCDDGGSGLCEAYVVTKTGPSHGGVLCCRDPKARPARGKK